MKLAIAIALVTALGFASPVEAAPTRPAPPKPSTESCQAGCDSHYSRVAVPFCASISKSFWSYYSCLWEEQDNLRICRNLCSGGSTAGFAAAEQAYESFASEATCELETAEAVDGIAVS